MSHAPSSPGATVDGTRSRVSRDRVLDALSEVIDPELDEPITTLRFVQSVAIGDDGFVDVVLRLPTPQCAPNFAFLMGADARRAVAAVPGVQVVQIRFEDHYTGDEINVALREGGGFTSAFPGETEDDDLEALRALFTRKALIARQWAACEHMLADGWSEDAVVAATVADLPATPDAVRALELRRQLGLAVLPDAPAFVQPNGIGIARAELTRWRRASRLVKLSLEANGGMCRDLLRTRYGLDPEA